MRYLALVSTIPPVPRRSWKPLRARHEFVADRQSKRVPRRGSPCATSRWLSERAPLAKRIAAASALLGRWAALLRDWPAYRWRELAHSARGVPRGCCRRSLGLQLA